MLTTAYLRLNSAGPRLDERIRSGKAFLAKIKEERIAEGRVYTLIIREGRN